MEKKPVVTEAPQMKVLYTMTFTFMNLSPSAPFFNALKTLAGLKMFEYSPPFPLPGEGKVEEDNSQRLDK